MVLAESLLYPFRDLPGFVAGGVIAFLNLLLIGMPWLFGYMVLSLRHLMYEGEPCPSILKDIGHLYKEGLKMMAVYIAGFIWEIALAVIALVMIAAPYFLAGYLIGGITDQGLVFALQVIAYVFMLLPLLAFSAQLLLWLVWLILSPAVLADTRSMRTAANPLVSLKIAREDLRGFTIFSTQWLIVFIVTELVSLIYVLSPWTRFLERMAYVYLLANFYRGLSRRRDVDIPSGD